MKTGYSHLKCGLIGEKLGHSFSEMIHREIADYPYELIELSPCEVGDFVKSRTLDAYNVTVPYKKTVMPFLDYISPEAKAIGAVNTIVCGKNGKLYGYNTDHFGFSYMLDVSKIEVSGKKVIVFGAGGASATVCTVLRERGVRELTVIGSKDNNGSVLKSHYDAEIIINTTPVGMYPKNGYSPVDLSLFPLCEGVLDVIYNPSKTKLLLDAEKRGLPHINGLSMLVAQAVKAFEFFTGDPADYSICDNIIKLLEFNTKNIILIGMPGCGKSTVGKTVAEKLSRPFYDADKCFCEFFGKTPADVIREDGEEKFRQMEHEIAEQLGKISGAVIATGGGIVTRSYNYDSLHQNGTIVFIERKLENLPTNGRPLSQSNSLESLYNARIDAYRYFADVTVSSTEIPGNTAELIISSIKEI